MRESSELLPRASQRIAPPAPPQYHGRMGFSETIFLFFLALLIFGPKRLPEIARQVGKIVADLKRASNEFQAQIQSEISQMELQEERNKILPPAEPAAGTVPALSTPPQTAPVNEEHPVLKAAPDA